MKHTLLIVLGAFATGVFAQAPVVDVSQQQTTISANALATNTVEIEQRLQTLERIVSSRSDSQQRMQQQLDFLQGDVDELRGSLELHTHQLEKVLERQRELYLKIDQSLSNFQSQSQQVSNQLTSGADTSAQPLPQSPDVQAAYQNAVNLILRDKDYDAAVPAFESFLQQFPDSEFTDNAHYWLAQLLYNGQNFDKAQIHFNQVVDKFPSSTKRADSLFKMGMIALQLNDNARAQGFFERVITEYPDSTSARLAQQQL